MLQVNKCQRVHQRDGSRQRHTAAGITHCARSVSVIPPPPGTHASFLHPCVLHSGSRILPNAFGGGISGSSHPMSAEQLLPGATQAHVAAHTARQAPHTKSRDARIACMAADAGSNGAGGAADVAKYAPLGSVRQVDTVLQGDIVLLEVEPPDPSTLSSAVLPCCTLRHLLSARPSPLLAHNNWDGNFVMDDDRVAISALWTAPAGSEHAGEAARPSRLGDAGRLGQCTAAASPGPDGAPAAGRDGDGQVVRVRLPPFTVRAGARSEIWMNPLEVNVAVVTCGALCPGMNDVVQNIVRRTGDYGVPTGNVLGIRNGFRGFHDPLLKPMVLSRQGVDSIHLQGGTVLGASPPRSPDHPDHLEDIFHRIKLWELNMLFVVGGDGAGRCAHRLAQRCLEEKVACAVVCVPKSMDNELLLIDRSFGFDTAVEEAQRPLLAAKVEASSAYQGIGLVKLQGKHSGFLVMQASLASGVVDACLIPEVPFQLDGPNGVFSYLERVLREKGHAVMCVAEGAGDQMLRKQGEWEEDDMGQPVLPNFGPWLRRRLRRRFPSADVKYIDPTHMIRTIVCNAMDHIYCKVLAYHAVDAAMSGYTDITVGQVNSHFALFPTPVVLQASRRVDPNGKMWNRLRSSIGQPNFS